MGKYCRLSAALRRFPFAVAVVVVVVDVVLVAVIVASIIFLDEYLLPTTTDTQRHYTLSLFFSKKHSRTVGSDSNITFCILYESGI